MTSSLFDSPDFNARLFFPREDQSDPPAGAQDIDVDVHDARLHLRIHRALPIERATVLLFHGNGEVVADYDDAAPRFASIGARLAVVDYRGYGRSTGVPTLPNVVADSNAVVDALVARATSPVVVMGRSLGSACVHHLYATERKDVVAYILESGFSSLDELVARRDLRPPRTASVDEIARFDPLRQLAQGTRPLLVMHGSDDDLIDVREAHAAFKAAGAARKTLAIVDGYGHNDIALAPSYFATIRAFLDDVAGTMPG